MTAWCVFFYQSVYFFTNGVYQDFHHNIKFYDFCKTVLVKKMHTLPRCGLIFPFQAPYFLHWLFSSTLLTQLKPLKPQNKLQKKSRALPSSSHWGLREPDPANTCSEKMTSQPTFFCRTNSPKSVMNLHRLFKMSYINTHFDMFFKNEAMYKCHIFVGICWEA